MTLFSFHLFLIWFSVLFTSEVIVKCRAQDKKEHADLGIHQFGNPAIFVTTEDQNFHPYRRIDNHRSTFIENEYMFYKSSAKKESEVRMIMYEPEDVDPVLQNLGKEMYWLYLNSSGVLPSMTVINTTVKSTNTFFTKENDTIQYHNTLSSSSHSTEPIPPIDVFFEIPAETRSFKFRKSLIDYNSWGFFKWSWTSPNYTVSNLNNLTNGSYCTWWYRGKGEYEIEGSFNFDAFNVIPNPCIPDLFLQYISLIVSPGRSCSRRTTTRVPYYNKHFYITVAAFNVETEETKFYNLTSLLCPQEECYLVAQVVLTNDHLVLRSRNIIFVSHSINQTGSTEETENTEKMNGSLPTMGFEVYTPCVGFEYNCSSDTTETKLYYNPVCYLLQIPNYEDILIMSYKFPNHESESGFNFTVLYAAKPYDRWLPLFIGATNFSGIPIVDIIGMFYNHQLEHFDITVYLKPKDGKNYAKRFVLPKPNNQQKGHPQNLSSNASRGFTEFTFPNTFDMDEVTVNPTTMDVLFTGNSLWIAESGGPLVYLSVGTFPGQTEFYNKNNPDKIRKCRFNHPDRFFVCINKENKFLYIGRTAYQYSVVRVERDRIEAINSTFEHGPGGLNWVSIYRKTLRESAEYTPAFSGNILYWYIDYPSSKEFFTDIVQQACKRASRNNQFITFDQYINTNFRGLKIKYDKQTQVDYEEITNADYRYCVKEWEKNRLAATNKKPTNTNSKPSSPKLAPSFSMLALHPHEFKVKREQSHGPLVPFLIDSTHAILFEAEVPGPHQSMYLYFGVVNIGEKIQCPTETEKVNCELYVRHIKRVDKFLPGFRLALYIAIIKPIPMRAIPTSILINVDKHTNEANVTLIKRETDKDAIRFGAAHIGQTIYIPGFFSILLKGFPNVRNTSTMWGFTTVIETKQVQMTVEPFKSWLIDLSTCRYREIRLKEDREERNKKVEDENAIVSALNREYRRIHEAKAEFNEQRAKFGLPPAFDKDGLKYPHLLIEQKVDRKDLDLSDSKDVPFRNCERVSESDRPWISGDGGCHHILTLEDNPVLKSHGGRISLDRLDSVSFLVKILATTQIGSLMLYRPMIVITNSNPDVLIVDKIFTREQHFQTMKINMRPKGIKMGVSTVVVRSVVASIECETPSSITFTVAVHRAEGRRLFADYPIPLCHNQQIFHRPWHTDHPNCIKFEELADKNHPEIKRNKQVIFKTLPINYRPPSFRGAQIPLSVNIYNADPSAKPYHEWYQVSKTTKKFDKNLCFHKETRLECGCTDIDKVQEDPIYSDCKEKVYTVRRGKEVPIIISYDPIMRVEDQLEEFVTKKGDLFVYIEEVNGRREFSVVDAYTNCGEVEEDCRNELLDEINRNPVLNGGKKFVDAKSLKFVLYGTGLFHFKAGLGKFDTFEDVTGYFILYSDSNDLNDVKLMTVMFLTLTVCFGLLFFGFLRVRRRITAHLPQNAEEAKKHKVE